MLKGISPLITPKLLKIMSEMGHGDEIVLADAHFPGHSLNKKIIRLDGIAIAELLDGILPLFELDSYAKHACIMMAPVPGDNLDKNLLQSYDEVIRKYYDWALPFEHIDRFEFYTRAEKAFAVVMTGELAKYGNIILKKGVTPIC